MHKYIRMVTSTPLKTQTIQLLKMDRWPSPVERTPTQTSTALLTNLDSLKVNDQKENLSRLNDNRQEESKEFAPAATGSIDKICLGKDSPKADNAEKETTQNQEVSVKIIEKKRLIILDSDEEEIWKSRSDSAKRKKSASTLADIKNLTKKKISGKKNVAKSSVPTVEEMRNRDSDNIDDVETRIAGKTRNDISRSKNVLGISKANLRKKSLKDSNLPILFTTQKKRVKKTNYANETLNVRRSTRKRCRPLEFWNGERIRISNDFTVGSGQKKKKILKKIKDADLVPKKINQVDQITTSVQNVHGSSKSGKNINVKADDEKIEKAKNRSRLVKSRNSKANVRFYSAIDENLRPGEQINSVELQALKRQELPEYENYVTIPQMKNVMEKISSAVIVIKPKSIYENQASDQHHLIFCVMDGTVKTVIENLETNEEMKPCWHFIVPSGASYSIENVDGKSAILSRFEIACGTPERKNT